MAKKVLNSYEHPNIVRSADYGRLPNNRIDWFGDATKNCIHLAMLGFSVRTIAQYTGLTINQVNGRLRNKGMSVMAYRNGNTESAQRTLRRKQVIHETKGRRKRKLA